MSPTPHTFKPETRPQDCWDWVTPEDVCRHALAAFYLARESVKQPPGRRFAEADGTSWACRENFGDNLAVLFELRLKTEGYQLGMCADWVSDAKQLQAWTRPTPWHPDELQHPEVSTTLRVSPGYGAAPHGSEAEAEPAFSGKNHIGALDAAAAVRLPPPSFAPEKPPLTT